MAAPSLASRRTPFCMCGAWRIGGVCNAGASCILSQSRSRHSSVRFCVTLQPSPFRRSCWKRRAHVPLQVRVISPCLLYMHAKPWCTGLALHMAQLRSKVGSAPQCTVPAYKPYWSPMNRVCMQAALLTQPVSEPVFISQLHIFTGHAVLSSHHGSRWCLQVQL